MRADRAVRTRSQPNSKSKISREMAGECRCKENRHIKNRQMERGAYIQHKHRQVLAEPTFSSANPFSHKKENRRMISKSLNHTTRVRYIIRISPHGSASQPPSNQCADQSSSTWRGSRSAQMMPSHVADGQPWESPIFHPPPRSPSPTAPTSGP